MRFKHRKTRKICTFDKLKIYFIDKAKAIDVFIDDLIDELNKECRYSNIGYSHSNNETNFFNTNSTAALFANDSNCGHNNHDCHSHDCNCD